MNSDGGGGSGGGMVGGWDMMEAEYVSPLAQPQRRGDGEEGAYGGELEDRKSVV